MDLHQAINNAVGEITPQPWEYTDGAGVTLTAIPEGLTADPGEAEVTIRVTVDRVLAAETGITTAAMPGLLAALEARTGWEHVTVLNDLVTVAEVDSGGVLLSVTEVHYGPTTTEGETAVVVAVPEAQRMPLVSALARATDVARGWEG